MACGNRQRRAGTIRTIKTMVNAQASIDQKRNGRACPPMTKARVNPGLRPVRTASTHVDGGAEHSGYSQYAEDTQGLSARSITLASDRFLLKFDSPSDQIVPACLSS